MVGSAIALKLLRRILPLVLLTLAAGCAWTVRPPNNVADSVPIYLTDYGRHTSVIMPLSDQHMVEYAFGDWNWFAKNESSGLSAVRALLFSKGSTLGRRYFVKTNDVGELMRLSGAERVEKLAASREKVKRLTDRLDRAYTKRIDTWHFNPLTHLDHVRSSRHYWGLDNCNNVTASWLRELGVQTSGWPILSKFKVDRASPEPAAEMGGSARAARGSPGGAGETARSPADMPSAPVPPRGPPATGAYHRPQPGSTAG